MMPEMDGEELCRRIKADEALSFVPVVLLTARATREDRLSGLREGADAYLGKPFAIDELLLTVGNQVRARRRFRERLARAGRALPELPIPWATNRDDRRVARFLDHLHRTLAEHLSDETLDPGSLAEAMHLSRSTLYRRIKEALDDSPMEVIWEFRLRQARAWLEETDGTVAEVAYAVGFKSVSHFSRRYRERFGEPPSAHLEV